MNTQDTDLKQNLLQRFLVSEERSPYFARFLFLFVGGLLTLSAFFVLQSFVSGLANEERARASQDLIEEVVEDFNALTKPFDALAALIAVSDQPQAEDIQSMLAKRTQEYQHYSQILWFSKAPDKEWSVKTLLEDANAPQSSKLEVDSALLKSFLSQGALNASQMRVAEMPKRFEAKQHRQSPKMLTEAFIALQAAEQGNAEKGFLVAVLDAAKLYDEAWINQHRHLAYMRVKNIDTSDLIFEFDRKPGQQTERAQIYEFPFGRQNWEISGIFAQDPRSKFLNIFPYIVGIFGLALVGVGAIYIRANQRQAEALAEMNEALEQKNFELKVEVDERERLAQAVEDAEFKSRTVIDSVGDIIFELDDRGSILFLNKAWKGLTGFDVEQSVGQSLVQLIYPQDQDQVVHDFKALVAEQIRELRCFTQLRVKEGTFKAVELVMSTVTHTDEGQIRVIGTFTDIEERRRAERALSDAEKKYRSIVENAAGGIYQLTPEGLYLSANRSMAHILGYESPEQLLREVKNANEQLYTEPSKRREFYARLENEKDALNQEVRMRKRDGSVIWVNESARAVHDEQGGVLFIEGSIEDITDRKTSEAAIHEAKIHSDLANRAKSEFLSNMSHELRTPLNSIIGFSEMIKNEVYGELGNKAYWEYARDIHDSGQKLLRVINEILDISKIEAGERQLNEGVVNIENIMNSALDLLDTKIGDGNLVITKALDDVPDVIGEELALKQVVLNLLSNAVKYTPDQGRITISGHVSRDGRLHVSVTDTGIGLDDYEMEKALSPFGQVESELDRHGSGTGLGLTLVDALVKLHGGEFELFSQKGIGTTATVILPNDRIVKPKNKALKENPQNIDNKEKEDN
ncbi:MAG: PAS domain-containing sensor histidine kinase [Pseudomonadota bacterium]